SLCQRGAKHVAVVFLVSPLLPIVPAASARSFLFCPPSTPTNSRMFPWTLPEPKTPVLVQAPL
ncbi:hypothetical protein BGY98DRAFT_1017798, partial [Russula aff. rugulosa BPL654]